MTQAALAAPLETPLSHVETPWVDYNGHLNMAYYNVLFDRALDHVFDRLGIGIEYARTQQCSCFTAEAHVTYLQELAENDPVRITFQLLDWDAKRIHYFEHMYHAEKNYLAATSEQIAIHVSMETRRAAFFPDRVKDQLAQMMDTHHTLPRPAQAGHVIAIPHKTNPTGKAE